MDQKTQLQQLIDLSLNLVDELALLSFEDVVDHVYNPLTYAWPAHAEYLKRYASGKKRVIFLGMNPGPFGMVQTGVPFGEIHSVRDWLKIDQVITPPQNQYVLRPIEGYSCQKSEVSGKRLWELFRVKFGTAEHFFSEHFVMNYCPLAFFRGKANVTPDKLPKSLRDQLQNSCNQYLAKAVHLLQPEWVVGVGGWAQKQAMQVFANTEIKIGKVLHPSPASPLANRGWAQQAEQQLHQQGIW